MLLRGLGLGLGLGLALLLVLPEIILGHRQESQRVPRREVQHGLGLARAWLCIVTPAVVGAVRRHPQDHSPVVNLHELAVQGLPEFKRTNGDYPLQPRVRSLSSAQNCPPSRWWSPVLYVPAITARNSILAAFVVSLKGANGAAEQMLQLRLLANVVGKE